MVKLISLHFARVSFRSSLKFIGKTNVTINEEGKRKRASEKKREERDGATGDDRTNHGACSAANQSTLLLLSHIVHFYVYISFELICRRTRYIYSRTITYRSCKSRLDPGRARSSLSASTSSLIVKATAPVRINYSIRSIIKFGKARAYIRPSLLLTNVRQSSAPPRAIHKTCVRNKRGAL